VPTLRPGDQVTDPSLFDLARRRWPGHRVTGQMLADVALLEGRPLHVPATPAVVAAGLAEVQRENTSADHRAATQRGYERMGFDPTADYRKKGA
jgi:hypothetical protein